MIRRLSELVEEVKGAETKKLIVAVGEDPHTIEAVARGVNEGMIKAHLVGNRDNIYRVAKEHGVDPGIFEITHEPDPTKAVKEAVRLVREGEGDMLMKGLVSTVTYMRAILDKQQGLLPEGALLSHVTVVEFPTYPKLIIAADVAVIIHPDLNQKVQILKYTIKVAHELGIEMPKAAIISAIETVNPKMPSSVDAAIIKVMAERGQIRGAIVDGPLAFDLAVSKESTKIKGVKSEVAGDADIVLFPDIVTGNVFFKTATWLAGAELAAVVAGTTAPCILTSRGDREDSKFYSIALAAKMAGKGWV